MSFQNLRTKPKILIAIAVPILFLFILSAVAFFSLSSVVETNKSVVHTHNVLSKALKTISTAVDMETGMRGYLLAGKEEFLDPYKQGEIETYQAITDLQKTVADNPKQVKRLDEVRDVLKEWQKIVTEPTIKLRREIGDSKTMNDMSDLVGQAKGKAYFDRFRGQIETFITRETNLLKERRILFFEAQTKVKNFNQSSVLTGTINDQLNIMAKSEEWVVHTYKVIILANDLLATAVNMETGMRGYLLAGKNTFLEPYEIGKGRFETVLNDLSITVNDNPAQVKLLEEISITIHEWQNKVTEPTIALRRIIGDANTMDDMADLIGEARGKKYFDQFRLLMADFSAEEKRLMGIRQTLNIDTINTTNLTMMITVFLAIGIGFILAWVIGNGIANPIIEITNAVSRLAAGNTEIVIPGKQRGDELGELSRALSKINSNAQEATRIKIALDNCQANVMLCDNDLYIVYLNNSINAMMRNAESDVKKELIDFKSSDLLGSSLDSFYENPSDQRNLLQQLASPHSTVLEIGGRTFDLTFSPVKDSSGTRLGTVAEWNDITEELAAEKAATTIANTNRRVKIALDNCGANVMVANADYEVIYCNQAALQMFKNAQNDIHSHLPDFDVDKILGSSIDIFHSNPAHQRKMLDKLTQPYTATIKMGESSFTLSVNRIINENDVRIGTVIEWEDITQRLNMENEIGAVVRAAVAGDFTQQLNIEGKSGFMLRLSEAINNLTNNTLVAVDEVGRMLGALSSGNLTDRITSEYEGAFLRLKDDSNNTAKQLTKIVGDLVTSSDKIDSAAAEISSSSVNLSERTEVQASTLEETASSMEELTTTVRENSVSASHASELAKSAQKTANQGSEVIKQAVEAMTRIEDSSMKITDIIGVIDEIAFQTNLLALNAAVEAARAGEAGRGFAVVATEVRTLAQRSSVAAKDIKGLIVESGSQVREGVARVNEGGKSLSEILDSTLKVTTMIDQIALASKEQANGIGEVSSAVAKMDEMTQQNAAMVEESTATSKEMAYLANSMNKMLNFFTLNNAISNPDHLLSLDNDADMPSPYEIQTETSNLSQNPQPLKPVNNDHHKDSGWEEF